VYELSEMQQHFESPKTSSCCQKSSQWSSSIEIRTHRVLVFNPLSTTEKRIPEKSTRARRQLALIVVLMVLLSVAYFYGTQQAAVLEHEYTDGLKRVVPEYLQKPHTAAAQDIRQQLDIATQPQRPQQVEGAKNVDGTPRSSEFRSTTDPTSRTTQYRSTGVKDATILTTRSSTISTTTAKLTNPTPSTKIMTTTPIYSTHLFSMRYQNTNYKSPFGNAHTVFNPSMAYHGDQLYFYTRVALSSNYSVCPDNTLTLTPKGCTRLGSYEIMCPMDPTSFKCM